MKILASPWACDNFGLLASFFLAQDWLTSPFCGKASKLPSHPAGLLLLPLSLEVVCAPVVGVLVGHNCFSENILGKRASLLMSKGHLSDFVCYFYYKRCDCSNQIKSIPFKTKLYKKKKCNRLPWVHLIGCFQYLSLKAF